MVVGIFVLLATLSPGPAVGSEFGGINLFASPSIASSVIGAGTSLMAAWNDTQPYAPAGTYGAGCFGFRFVPTQSYLLERIEFYAGGKAGTVTVSVYQGIGSGFPTGPALGSVTYVESSTSGWQGANLAPSVPVISGATYYIKYAAVEGALASTASSGTVIPHLFSPDCPSWRGPFFSNFKWMARFHGSAATPAAQETWGGVKARYRTGAAAQDK